MSNAEFLKLAIERWKQCKEFSATWRQEARDDYAFASGEQWLADDRAKLEAERRPVVTFNYSEKMVDAVVGAEISARQEASYLPRETSDSQQAELWTETARWVRDNCNAEDEESEAFRDALICGMGWTETSVSYEEDPEGKILIERRDPIEMYWDPAASKACLEDMRYVFHAVWVDKKDAERMWPGKIFSNVIDGSEGAVSVINPRNRYDDAQDDADEERRRQDQVQILHYQCYERETWYRVMNPDGNSTTDLSQSEFKDLKDRIEQAGIKYVRFPKRTYYRAYIAGETLLEKTVLPSQTGFTLRAITAKRDRNRNTWYGLIKVMKDPQRWANKWLCQILHIVNSNAKGGLLAELGAFVDPTKAKDEWAKPDSVTLLKEGGMGKVREKQMAQYPNGLDRLMDFALQSLPMVTGINLEVLGLVGREQAGVLESQRKQAAYGILSPYFNALRRYRKDQGRILMEFIQEFIADGRVVRINGKGSEQFVQLLRLPDSIRFDIIVDTAPNSPNSKRETFETLEKMMPAMLKAGVPIPPTVFDYAPLPPSLAQEWKQMLMQNSPKPEQMQQLQQELGKLQQENQKLKMDKSEEQAKLQAEVQLKIQELEMKRRAQEQEFALEIQKMEQEFALRRAELEQELSLKREGFQQEMAIEREKFGMEAQNRREEMGLKRETAEGDLRIKALTAGVDPEGANKVLESLVENQEDLSQSLDKNQQMLIEVVKQLSDTLSKDRKIVFDKNGKPVGLKLV